MALLHFVWMMLSALDFVLCRRSKSVVDRLVSNMSFCDHLYYMLCHVIA
jgi:hypothetical protein